MSTENTKNLNLISSAKYDIYTKLLDLAANGEYLTSLDDFDNADFLRSGLFGYVTEGLALMMRDSSFQKTVAYREHFLNTAIIPKSVYNWAKTFDVDPITAVPAIRYAEFRINTDTINSVIANSAKNISAYQTKYGIVEASNFIVLDKSNAILAGDTTFMLEHSIEIYKNANGRYIVKYCVNEQNVTTEFAAYPANGLITTSISTIDGKTYVVFKALVAQYEIQKEDRIISGSSYLDTKVHKFTYDSGQLCGLKLEYTKNSTTEDVELHFSNLNVVTQIDTTNKIAFYSLLDDNTIEISFESNLSKNSPAIGSVLSLTTYLTKGFSGNISYNGDAVFLLKQDDFKSLPVYVSLDNTTYSSGVDSSTLADLKNTIVTKLSTRNSIITENDLNTWFNTQSVLLENVNNSKIVFKKEKDNLLNRIFSAYLLLRDGVDVQKTLENGQTVINSSYVPPVVPTTTSDVTCTITTNNGVLQIDPTCPIYCDSSTGKFSTTSTNTSTDIEYRTPFTVLLNKTYNSVSYYYTEASDQSELEFYSIEDLKNFTFIPSYTEVIHTNKNSSSTATSNDLYHFKFYFASDKDLTSSNVTVKDASLIFGNETFSIGDSSSLKFKKVETSSETTDSTLEYYYLDCTLQYVGIYNSSKNSQIQLKNTSGKTINLNEEEYVGITFKVSSDFDGSVRSSKKMTIFNALDDIMNSGLTSVISSTTNTDSSTSNTFVIKALPLVAAKWYTESENRKWFIKQIFIFINMMKDNIDKLETTTFFNLKFMNTYGVSDRSSAIRTNLKLALRIYLKTDALNQYSGVLGTTTTDLQKSLEKEIRDYIRVTIDNANTSGEFSVSKVIMATQATYIDYIHHIDFEGLNGTLTQYIKMLDDDDVTNTSAPLEYLSLDCSKVSDSLTELEQNIVFEKI